MNLFIEWGVPLIYAIALILLCWRKEVLRRREWGRRTADLKNDVLSKAAANDGYFVPAGFVDESLNTSLHVAMRELRREGRIRLEGLCVDGQIEWWKAAA